MSTEFWRAPDAQELGKTQSECNRSLLPGWLNKPWEAMLSIQTRTCFKPGKKTYSKKPGKPRTRILSFLTGVTSLHEPITHTQNDDPGGKGRQVNPKFLTLSVVPSSSVSGKRGVGRMCVYQKEKSKCLGYFVQRPHCPHLCASTSYKIQII